MKPKLKIPIARIGKWHSDKYKTVEFTQEDFNHLKDNFEKNVRGYEPYLRYGHSVKGAGIFGGEKALGHLKELYQLGDVLWGVFEPTNETVVEEVRNGEYRYASAEIVRNAKDKRTGERLRIFLKGHSLTNEPFVPNLPRNLVDDTQYLSEEGADSEFCTLALSEYIPSMTMCSNCGVDTTGGLNQAGLCSACNSAVKAALEPLAKPELTSLQSIVHSIKSLFNKVDSLPNQVASAMTEQLQVLSEQRAALEANTSEVDPAEEPSPEEEPAEVTPPSEEPVQVPEQEVPTEDLAPAEPEPEPITPPEPVQENIEMDPISQEAIDALRVELEALKAEKAEAERIALEAKAELETKLEAERAAAEAAALEAEAIKEREFAQVLSDRVETLVSKGVPPVLAERAKSLIQNLRAAVTEDQTFVLAEGDEAVDLVEGVFGLLSESTGVINYEQFGSQPSDTKSASNPWADRIANAKNKRSQG